MWIRATAYTPINFFKFPAKIIYQNIQLNFKTPSNYQLDKALKFLCNANEIKYNNHRGCAQNIVTQQYIKRDYDQSSYQFQSHFIVAQKYTKIYIIKKHAQKGRPLHENANSL